MKLKDKDKDVVSILEENDIRICSTCKQGTSFYTELEFFSTLDEDFVFSVWHNGTKESFINEFFRYAWDFDPEEHAEMWIPLRGTNGVPGSIRALLEDADGIDKFLKKVGDDLNRCVA